MGDFIPNNWKISLLSELADINPKFENKSDTPSNLMVSFIRMEDVSNSAKIQKLRIRPYSSVSKGFTNFRNHDVLLAKITPCFENGKGGYAQKLVNNTGFGSTEFHVLRVKDDLNSIYIYHYVNSPAFRAIGERHMTGSAGQRRVTSDFLRTYPLIYPPLPEQKKIAKILTAVDTVIEKTQAQIDKLNDLKTGMMQELLTKGIGRDGKPHTEFKESAVGLIPVGWECAKMTTLAKITDGAHHTPKYTSHGIPFIRVTDLKSENIFSGNNKYISLEEHLELIKRCKPETNDILYSKNGTIGITRLITWNTEFSIFVSLALIKIKNDKVLPEYLALLMDSPIVHEQIRTRSKQGTVTNLHLEEIRDFDIPLPDLIEQKKVVNNLSALIAKIQSNDKKLQAQIRVKTALMQDLLTGKVRVTVDPES